LQLRSRMFILLLGCFSDSDSGGLSDSRISKADPGWVALAAPVHLPARTFSGEKLQLTSQSQHNKLRGTRSARSNTMGPEMKSKKRKGMINVCLKLSAYPNWHGTAAAHDDEVAKVKKVKQMEADILPKKRKGATQELKPWSTVCWLHWYSCWWSRLKHH